MLPEIDLMNESRVRAITGPRVEVKKSVFVATVVRITDESKARERVKDMKKRDRKANHVAFAYRIGTNPVREGMSDDGEPRGTAGLPLLMLLRHRDISGVLVMVTRYWGGIKLGPGGLKRAYSEAAQKALELSGV